MNTLYLVCYDIACQRRWYRVEKCLRGYGQRWHYSVFLCRLSSSQHRALVAELSGFIDLEEDSVRIYPLCRKDWAQRLTHGRPPPEMDFNNIL